MRTEYWMQTYTGRRFYPLRPENPGLVCIEDIAHALSLICRFGGHCRWFYSVAQHSILVSRMCKLNPLVALLHDAAEAYLGDIIYPIKQSIFVASVLAEPGAWPVVFPTRISEIEVQLKASIFAQLRIDIGENGTIEQLQSGAEINRADRIMLATERRDLLLPTGEEWGILQGLEGESAVISEIIPWDAKTAESRFLETYYKLRGWNGPDDFQIPAGNPRRTDSSDAC